MLMQMVGVGVRVPLDHEALQAEMEKMPPRPRASWWSRGNEEPKESEDFRGHLVQLDLQDLVWSTPGGGVAPTLMFQEQD